MGLTLSSGVFSGLDTEQIITELMNYERQPLERLNQQKAAYEAKISSYGTLKSTLSTLKGTLTTLKSNDLLSLSATSSNTAVFTATATSSAAEASYEIKVSHLATSQSLYSEQFTAETSEVADLTTYATQKLKIQVGSGTSAEITINASNNSLTGIRDAINDADVGVTGSVINDGSGYRLVLRAEDTGASNRITVLVDEDNDGTYEESTAETDTTGLSRLAMNATYDADGAVTGGTANMTQSQAAVDASLVVDGLTVTRDTNTIDDLITGVTLTLLDDSAGSTLALTVAKDNSAITTDLNAFVSAYNDAVKLARTLSVPVDGQSVILAGDSTSRSIISGLRTAVSTTYESYSLAGLGFSHDLDGNLSFDASMLDSVLEDDLDGAIGAINAMADSLEDTVSNFIYEMIPARTNGITTTIDRIGDKMDNWERRLENRELMYRERFAALEKVLSQVQQSGDFLAQQLGALSGINGGS